jgi:hypothetical protein
MLGGAGRALVGDLEDANLLDRVAEELDPQRVLLGRREHVEQSAPHRQLAPLADHLHPRVADFHQPRDHVLGVGVVARHEPHRLEIAEAGHDRLQHRPHRRDDHLERPAELVPGRAGVREPAQHRDPLPDGVRSGREPLVRERLPPGERRDRLRRQEGAERRRQVLRLPRGRGHREHESPPAVGGHGPGREGRDQQRPQGRRRDEVALARAGRVGAGERGSELGIFGYGSEQSSKAHGFPTSGVRGSLVQRARPTRGRYRATRTPVCPRTAAPASSHSGARQDHC